ncbi:YkoP family protein [Cellvibrio sp. ARAG 10.3]|jgi:hypothetical protein|uniref:YkoP family protein n=1 Tax=Cellvibrio sp. ARAG 10.3 TaxID=3451358 RepID=UPI002C8C922B|nr:hypothetical protein [Cellvibrio sp.]
MSGNWFNRIMTWYDTLWRRLHRVEKIDELLSLSYEVYKGERKAMNDDTWLEPGDALAILHFNHECFNAGNNPREYARGALRFRRLLVKSLNHLASRINNEKKFKDIKALHGVTWIAPHGEKVGFMIERLPTTWGNRMRQFYFRLLLKAFFPTLAARENDRLQPHAFWLTRNNLLNYFSEESHTDEFRNRKARNSESGGFESEPTPAVQLADYP